MNEQPRTVWVTGATSGIGRACVLKLLGLGHRVVALGRRWDRLHQLKESLPHAPLYVAACDVQAHEQVRRVYHALPVDFCAVDTLVNNAGLMLGAGTFDTLSADAMHTMVMTNCLGVLNNTSILLPSIKASTRGHIVNVTSIAARYPYVTGHVYAATKAFVEHFGANLRTELAAERVRVTNVAPGRADTEFQSVRMAGSTGTEPAPAAMAQAVTPLAAEDVADTICWALSQPLHANINAVELVPSRQALSFR
ncbi:SDR family NAD(P)-dependent oxidoreductase [Hydrogenophaga sp.]|uniref:SDR family NAD(P)-dependent oxidoreductase n=1 Tax=Hydrogenophaga sp. TaxID=1904254 RepID=UPI0025C47B8C|nr:SDR family NAD(P)-dependent oxidoreductase [Hydrogenophaga sp.]